MSKLRVLTAIAVLTCCGVLAAAAFAVQTEWAGNGYHLNSGQNGFLNHKVNLYYSRGHGENRAVCAGIREWEKACVGRGEYAVFELSFYVFNEPYLHNHDTEGGYFHGWYE
jgi:hypothetical protein